MNRRQFANTCIMCMSGSLVAPVLTGCQGTYYTSGVMQTNRISVPKSEFTYLRKQQPVQRPYVIVKNDAMEFPLYLYRFSDNEYSALLMKCTHQGNELQASGDHLNCSAHGSEFNNKGIVVQGPAERNLRAFKVAPEGDTIFIDLSL